MIDAFAAAERLLSCWQLGLVQTREIVEWADRLMGEADPSVVVPLWLIELSTRGPKAYSKLMDHGYPRPQCLSFEDRFAVMVEATSIKDGEALRRFTKWLLPQVMGGDFNDPLVSRGYLIDHLYVCGDVLGARRETIRLLKEHQGRHHRIKEALYDAALARPDRMPE